jgi:hypothetical protein
MQADIQEIIQAPQVQLHPIQWCAQFRLYSLHYHFDLSQFLYLQVALVSQHSVKQPRECVCQQVAQGQGGSSGV